MVLCKQDAFAMLLKERRKIYMGIIALNKSNGESLVNDNSFIQQVIQ